MAKDHRDRDRNTQHGQRPAPPSPIDVPPEAPSDVEDAPLEQTLDADPTHAWIYNADDCVRSLAYRAQHFGSGSPSDQKRIGPRSDLIPVVCTPGLNLKLIGDLERCGIKDLEALGDVSGGMLFPVMSPTYVSKFEVQRYLERTVSKFALERWLESERREDVRELIEARLALLHKRK